MVGTSRPVSIVLCWNAAGLTPAPDSTPDPGQKGPLDTVVVEYSSCNVDFVLVKKEVLIRNERDCFHV